jgi:hypothetical protein
MRNILYIIVRSSRRRKRRLLISKVINYQYKMFFIYSIAVWNWAYHICFQQIYHTFVPTYHWKNVKMTLKIYFTHENCKSILKFWFKNIVIHFFTVKSHFLENVNRKNFHRSVKHKIYNIIICRKTKVCKVHLALTCVNKALQIIPS